MRLVAELVLIIVVVVLFVALMDAMEGPPFERPPVPITVPDIDR